MEEINFYTTDCPRCKVIKKKLDDKNIQYNEITDKELMISLGFTMMPVLEVNGEKMNFIEANNWINCR